jgi:hypothetical protein
MILPNGRFCLIREKTVLHPGEQAGLNCIGGELLIVAEHWRDQADHDMRPDRPRGAWAHVFRTPAHDSLGGHILEVLSSHSTNEQIDHGPHHNWKRGGEDRHGLLSHPAVVALEVTGA